MNAPKPETLRLFIALWPDDATRTALAGLQTAMRGKIVPYANLHLTLAFLGQQEGSKLPAIKDVLTHLHSPAVELHLDRVGYFTRKRIAWVGTHQSPEALFALHMELAQGLARYDMGVGEEPPFKPHITLARDADLPPDLTFEPIVWRADRIVLVQSDTRAEGAQYCVLASRSLDEPGRLREELSENDPDRSVG